MNQGRDLLISCMALSAVPDWLPWPGGAPSLIEWAGQPPPGGGHPTWGTPAQRLRDASGRLLPNLLASYRQFLGFDLSNAGRIAVIGFSAGSNSGVRELLRSPLDRARLSFVACIDGIHPNVNPAIADTMDGAHYLAWHNEEGGLEDIADSAALDEGPGVVVTASDVAAPSSRNAKTADALQYLEYQVLGDVQRLGKTLVEPLVPPAFPPTSSPAERFLKPGEARPVPFTVGGCRRFVTLYYRGDQARDHVLQARIVVPDVLHAFLLPLWSGSDPRLLASYEPESSGEVIETTREPKLSSSALGWVPGGTSAAALLAATLLG